MGIADRPGYYWTAEGFNIEDLVGADVPGGPVYADRHLVVTRTSRPPGLRFAGEIDVTNSGAVADSLGLAFPEFGNPHLDLSRLSFCDISGIRAVVEAADSLGPGRHLRLHGLPPQLETVIRVTGWSALPSLELCRCRGGEA